MRTLMTVLMFLAACALIGCGGNSEPKRNRVSGKVTYDGKPVVFGDVVISPDGAKKNSGAQGFANIRDGQYDTGAEGGRGYGGGPAVLHVTAFDKSGGKILFEGEFQVTLPDGDATHDIDIPKGKGKEKQKSPEI
jgi:hypothetical protein